MSNFVWPDGVACAISLTYDDGLPLHSAMVGAASDSEGDACNLFPTLRSDVLAHPPAWRALADPEYETRFGQRRLGPWLLMCSEPCVWRLPLRRQI